MEASGSSPSFSCYSSDTTTSTTLAKVINEEEVARVNENGDMIEGDDYEFSFVLTSEEVSVNEIDSRNWMIFPVFKCDILVSDDVDREKDDEIDASAAITSSLTDLLIDKREESSSLSSCSSSEADESESLPSGSYCVWRPKADGVISKCKKSSSTGSGSKRWKFRYLLRRSNSEGKQPAVLLTPEKVKQKRNSGEESKVAGRWKAKTPVQERFYVQRRAENEAEKKKTYLPYRKDLVGLFGNVKGMGKMLPF